MVLWCCGVAGAGDLGRDGSELGKWEWKGRWVAAAGATLQVAARVHLFLALARNDFSNGQR